MNRGAGFTLIELAVVLAVMSIMASVVVPNFIEMTRNELAEKTAEQAAVLQDAARFFRLQQAKAGDPRWPGQPSSEACTSNGRESSELRASTGLNDEAFTNPWGHPYDLRVVSPGDTCNLELTTAIPERLERMFAASLPNSRCGTCGSAPAGFVSCCSELVQSVEGSGGGPIAIDYANCVHATRIENSRVAVRAFDHPWPIENGPNFICPPNYVVTALDSEAVDYVVCCPLTQ